MNPCGVGGSRSNTKRKRTQTTVAAFPFSEGNRILYATCLQENADADMPILSLAPAKVVKCTTVGQKKELRNTQKLIFYLFLVLATYKYFFIV